MPRDPVEVRIQTPSLTRADFAGSEPERTARLVAAFLGESDHYVVTVPYDEGLESHKPNRNLFDSGDEIKTRLDQPYLPPVKTAAELLHSIRHRCLADLGHQSLLHLVVTDPYWLVYRDHPIAPKALALIGYIIEVCQYAKRDPFELAPQIAPELTPEQLEKERREFTKNSQALIAQLRRLEPLTSDKWTKYQMETARDALGEIGFPWIGRSRPEQGIAHLILAIRTIAAHILREDEPSEALKRAITQAIYSNVELVRSCTLSHVGEVLKEDRKETIKKELTREANRRKEAGTLYCYGSLIREYDAPLAGNVMRIQDWLERDNS